MNIVHIIGPETGTIYPAIDTQQRWNGSPVVAFLYDDMHAMIANGDAADANGYGLATYAGEVVDYDDADSFEAVPVLRFTIGALQERAYVPEGRCWEVVEPADLLAP
ncbi:hypothetical protein ACHAAC_17085 [Aeromicrobium sp. CF4.19]|uniref:hypothetical protein n=1 Tax=Aeromicrobium sp. CF4.19 TaxID=3373082 RepID=UPI003EE51C0C